MVLEAGEEISDEMGPCLRGNGGEASVCQTLDTAATAAAEEEAGGATDWGAIHARAV